MRHLVLMWRIVAIVAVLLVLFASWSLFYYATRIGYEQLGWHPHGLSRQLINSFLGFLLFGTIMAFISPFFRKVQMDFFRELTAAMKKISEGDYKVNLIVEKGPHAQYGYGKLVQGINEMAVNLKAMEDMRQKFISDVSHEIQSPLTSIRGLARAMNDEELDRMKQQHYLDIIETESIRLSKLSENLLRLASLDSEHYPFEPASYRLDKQLQRLILACEPQWIEQELEMIVDLREVTIEADRDLLGQVWVNLFHNAIKFTPKGGVIHISLERADDEAVIHIVDTGIGIAEHDQAHIFERFYMVDKSRIRSISGSGLGLSIALKIVEMHRGHITINSKLGEGAAFTVSLPLHAASM
jgi:two-component system phosphate regulon sensor histidine kinase PhoR